MKSKHFFILFILIVNKIYSQTKKETEDWIKSKIEGYNYRDGKHNFHEYEVLFDKGNMFVLHPINKVNFCYQIPLIEITNVEITTNNWGGYTLMLKCKSNKCIMNGEYNNNIFYSDGNAWSKVELFLSKLFGDENLPDRMKKAISHLVTLNGGTIKKEVF
jgi:hypothetical protein